MNLQTKGTAKKHSHAIHLGLREWIAIAGALSTVVAVILGNGYAERVDNQKRTQEITERLVRVEDKTGDIEKKLDKAADTIDSTQRSADRSETRLDNTDRRLGVIERSIKVIEQQVK